MLAHEDVVSISQTLYKDARTQKTSSDFLIIAGIYADAVFSLDSKELGCQLYTDLVERIRQNPSCIALASSCKILHQAINSQLQSARYDTALAWIGILASLPGLPLEYQFIAQNRYGVAYIALGKFKDAKVCLDDAMELAEKSMKIFIGPVPRTATLPFIISIIGNRSGKRHLRNKLFTSLKRQFLTTRTSGNPMYPGI